MSRDFARDIRYREAGELLGYGAGVNRFIWVAIGLTWGFWPDSDAACAALGD